MPVDEDGYRPHPTREGDYYTPVTTGMLELFEKIKLEHGGTWKGVVSEARVSTRWFRYLRAGHYQTISYRTLEKVLTRTGMEHRMNDFPWYTPKQMVEMGIWRPMKIDGLFHGPPQDGIRWGDIIENRPD